jgi:putative copper export protein
VPLDGYAVARWLGYGATLTLVGLAVAPAILARSGHSPSLDPDVRRRGARLGLVAAALLLLASTLRLWYQARSFLEPGEAVTREVVGLVLGSGMWGTGWKLVTGIAVLLTVVWATPSLRKFGGLHRLLVLGLVAATPFAGHGAAAESAVWRGIILHAVHLLATGAWLGTLLVFAGVAFPPLLRQGAGAREADMARLVRTFSPLALVGAGMAVASGLVLSWTLVGSTGALLASEYGRWLVLKLALVAVVAGIGFRNWRVLTPRLGQAAAEPMARSAGMELAFGALILLVTAILVAREAPGL